MWEFEDFLALRGTPQREAAGLLLGPGVPCAGDRVTREALVITV